MTLNEYIEKITEFRDKHQVGDVEVGTTSILTPNGFKTPLMEIRHIRTPAPDSNLLEFEQNKIKGTWDKNRHRPSEKGPEIVFIW